MLNKEMVGFFLFSKNDSGGTRTLNPLIRSQVPCPLGHRTKMYDVARPTSALYNMCLSGDRMHVCLCVCERRARAWVRVCVRHACLGRLSLF